jgi:predicted transcriptional regulator
MKCFVWEDGDLHGETWVKVATDVLGYDSNSTIAKGDYTQKPGKPKVWFESLQSMAQVLSNENQELLKIIMERKPNSLKELGEMTGRKSSNLSRTLKLMANFGIIDLAKDKKNIRPIVKATTFKVEFGLKRAFG